ncbi:Lysylphosphatidylglycerol synthase TM region [Actinopolymorpha cephalotaxi]|uniref:Lysylphosphatidylglycerol synthase TM region n=1 Tax=Actinopolymorpha cephalotaxi TaxID=504797 RepID=A0A1I3A617_9ACTN|nr:lysylphosphatidylglycerol synthase transmembrane domain-containing protein [Actinopolymorpha cephalotaxi]NYH85332.1 uncharacterized membrane protein YbhN (UPF0104 family) [Actinopolymorpha cephalotaxi]SFH45316.1 Lysylphosphatidylglycerol synthase TM region [Actinopolymorpha cephalotaxi]
MTPQLAQSTPVAPGPSVAPTPPVTSIGRRVWTWLRPLVGIGILAVLVRRFGTGPFVAGLRGVDVWSVLAALGIGMCTTVLGAWRWCVVARGLGLPLSLRQAVADCYRAILLNSVLPAGVLGDVHRAVSHGRQSGDLGRGVRAVVLERTAGQVVLAAVGIGVLLTQSGMLAAATGTLPLSDWWIAAVGLGLLGVLPALAAWARWGTSTSAWRRAVRTAAVVRAGLLSKHTTPAVVALSVGTLVGHVCMFVVAARVSESPVPLGRLVPIAVLALMVMGLPLNVGGWGPREAFLALAFGAVGLGARQGVAISVAYGVLTLIACLPGIAVLFARRPHAGT